MSAFPWKGVAWDVDGTLVDSEPLHHCALIAAAAQQGLDLTDLDEATFVGVHIGEVWRTLAPKFPRDLRREDFTGAIARHYAAGAASLVPVPSAPETIEALAAMGVPQVCVSNSDRAIVDANLARLGAAGRMAGTVSLDDVREGKPAPEPYLKGAALLGLRPAEVLAVEDSLTGARSALRAGLSVALIWPQGRQHDLGKRVLRIDRPIDILSLAAPA